MNRPSSTLSYTGVLGTAPAAGTAVLPVAAAAEPEDVEVDEDIAARLQSLRS